MCISHTGKNPNVKEFYTLVFLLEANKTQQQGDTQDITEIFWRNSEKAGMNSNDSNMRTFKEFLL